jgi:uncharacterized protein
MRDGARTGRDDAKCGCGTAVEAATLRGMQVEVVDDAKQFLAAAGAHLAADAARHNLVLSLAHARVEHPGPGRYAWAHERGRVAGVALQSPPTFPAVVSRGTRRGAAALARAMAEHAPDLPGVNGDAPTAATFAGEWATTTRARVVPRAAQRLYRVTRLRRPPVVPGALRDVGPSEIPEVAAWVARFQDEIGEPAVAGDADRELAYLVDRGLLWCWDDGGRCAITSATPAVDGVSRVRHVYTPPERRRHGYAAACVGAVTATVQERGATACVLYTQLTNPTSNALYQRLGYEPIAEILAYRFDR